MRSHRSALAVLVAALVLFVTSCGAGSDETSDASTTTTTSSQDPGGNASDGAGSSLDAAAVCAAVSDTSVEAVLGTVPAPDQESQLGVSGCLWEMDNDNRLAVSTGTRATYSASLNAIRPTKTADVAGLGDEAFVASGFSSVTSGGTSGTTLWVLDGDKVYLVAAEAGSGDVDQAALEQIGQEVLAAAS